MCCLGARIVISSVVHFQVLEAGMGNGLLNAVKWSVKCFQLFGAEVVCCLPSLALSRDGSLICSLFSTGWSVLCFQLFGAEMIVWSVVCFWLVLRAGMVIWFVGRFQLLATGGLAVVYLRLFNPFTAPACTISGLKDVGTRLPTAYFSVL